MKLFCTFIVLLLVIEFGATSVLAARKKSPLKSTSKRKRQNGNCKITIPTDIPENEPVYLVDNNGSNKLDLFNPTGKETIVSPSATIYLFCPGKNNLLRDDTVNMTNIQCKLNKNFAAPSEPQKNYQLHNLNCTREISGDLRVTREKCSNNDGNVVDIGFKLNHQEFVTLFNVCYNNKTASAIYATHRIIGKAIKYNVKENERREFKPPGVPRSANPTKSYKRTNQMERFVEMFGEAQKYINTTSYLARGHLAPDADFIFSSSQFATYFYVNVAPQFQAINGGNWVRVETLARKLADHYQTDLIVHTGLYDILKLQNRKIYLEDDNLIEVPKWYWKVIINPATKAGIVMITSNNPFAPVATLRSEEFCQNVCEEAGIETRPFQNVRKGYTFCCEVNEFKRMVNVLPNSLNVPNLLQCGDVVLG